MLGIGMQRQKGPPQMTRLFRKLEWQECSHGMHVMRSKGRRMSLLCGRWSCWDHFRSFEIAGLETSDAQCYTITSASSRFKIHNQ